ncbi:MAG: hypothetical protein AMXMBFR84_14380 [Candidatus Hydrogenedentota bacterium]
MRTHTFLTRRCFLGSAAAGAALLALPAHAKPKPSDQIGVGFIGVGDRGSYILGSALELPEARVLAVADVKRDRREKAVQTINERYSNSDCKAYNEFEELIARDDIDAIVVASCDHWHVLHALAAVRAGKDVYVEKPLGVSIEQIKALRKAVRRRKRIFQFGTQQRSDERFRLACELVRNGRIGQLKSIKVWSPSSASGGPTNHVPVPETLDYNRWIGPAPFTPYTQDRETNQWWWFISDYALGFIAGWGIHPMDIALWGAGDLAASPVVVQGTGEFPREGVCNTATKWDITHTYDNGLTIQFASMPAKEEWKLRYGEVAEHGTAFEGSEGWIIVDRRHIKTYPESVATAPFNANDYRLPGSNHHLRNFLNSVKSRQDPVSPIEESVQSDIACHVADIAIRLQRPVRWDNAKERFIDDAEANARLTRPMREPWTL